MGETIISGLGANNPIPGSFEEVLYAQGTASGNTGNYPILLIGNMLSTGSATLETVVYGPDSAVQLQTEQDAIALFGTGSELHRMYMRATAVNTETPVYAIAVAESSGSKATITCAVATQATANGTIRFHCGDEFVDTSVVKDDSAANIATAVAAAINSKSKWPITASVTSSVNVVATAKQKGTKGNWIRIMTQVIANAGPIGTTISQDTETFLSGGSSDDDVANALATIAARRFMYIANSSADATNLGKVSAHCDALFAPTVGKRQFFFAGSVDTLANTITLTTGLNTAIAEMTWSRKGLLTPGELAANQAGIEAYFELPNRPRLNFANFGDDDVTRARWHVKASRLQTAWPSQTEIMSALNNGISPIAVHPSGATYLVNRVTTRFLNGSVSDYRIRDVHKARIPVWFADRLHAKNVLQHAGKEIADDPPEGLIPEENTITPTLYKATIFEVIDDMAPILQNVAAIKAGVRVDRSPDPASRMTSRTPLQPKDCAFQFGNQVAQVS